LRPTGWRSCHWRPASPDRARSPSSLACEAAVSFWPSVEVREIAPDVRLDLDEEAPGRPRHRPCLERPRSRYDRDGRLAPLGPGPRSPTRLSRRAAVSIPRPCLISGPPSRPSPVPAYPKSLPARPAGALFDGGRTDSHVRTAQVHSGLRLRDRLRRTGDRKIGQGHRRTGHESDGNRTRIGQQSDGDRSDIAGGNSGCGSRWRRDRK
jgi:hypothetical protein